MLQMGNTSLLETVMRNVVIFSRMKAHQKGEVMDLLGSRGLYRVIDGRQQHIAVSSWAIAVPVLYVLAYCTNCLVNRLGLWYLSVPAPLTVCDVAMLVLQLVRSNCQQPCKHAFGLNKLRGQSLKPKLITSNTSSIMAQV